MANSANVPVTFELTTTPGTISGKVNWYEKATGGDWDPVLQNPSPTIIHDDQDWMVVLEELTQTGPIWGAWTGNHWYFRIYFEQIGPGEGPDRLGISFAVNAATPYTYGDQTINIPSGTLPIGIYKLYAELELVDQNHLTPVSGLAELGSIKIVNA